MCIFISDKQEGVRVVNMICIDAIICPSIFWSHGEDIWQNNSADTDNRDPYHTYFTMHMMPITSLVQYPSLIEVIVACAESSSLNFDFLFRGLITVCCMPYGAALPFMHVGLLLMHTFLSHADWF